MAFTPSAAQLDAASTRFRLLFNRGWDSSTIVHEPFCEPIDSTGRKEVYHVPDAIGSMREWVGERIVEDLARQELELKNLTFEKTVAVQMEDFEDDTLGGYNPQFNMLGAAARQHPDILFTAALEAGFTKLGYDGDNFFDDEHEVEGGTWSNLGTAALDADAFEAGYTTMRQVKDSSGQPFDPLMFGGDLYLMVPPALEATARKIVLLSTLSGGGDNPNFQRAKLVVNSRLTSNLKWYLLMGNGPARPFVRQMRRKPKLTQITRADTEDVFYRNRIVYGVDGRWNVGRALPQFAYASTGED